MCVHVYMILFVNKIVGFLNFAKENFEING